MQLVLPDVSAHKRAIFEAYSEECATVCGKGHVPDSTETARVTLQFNVPLLEVWQRHREWKAGFKNIHSKNEKQEIKWDLTMDAVCLIRSKPSRATEANHKRWGERAREAGPSGWPLTSCTGFSSTPCWSERSPLSWENRSESRIIRFKMHTWDHYVCKTTKTNQSDAMLWLSYTDDLRRKKPKKPAANLRKYKSLKCFTPVAVSKDLT